MLHPVQMEKPSEPLGTSFTLGELQDVVSFGIAAYGPETKIYLRRFRWHHHGCPFSVGFAQCT